MGGNQDEEGGVRERRRRWSEGKTLRASSRWAVLYNENERYGDKPKATISSHELLRAS